MSSTAESEQQTLLIKEHDFGLPGGGPIVFEVVVQSAEGNAWIREVTVTDRSVDINDLCRRIASGEFNVTDILCSAGDIHFEENGREYRVATWMTTEVPEFQDEVKVSFNFKNSDKPDTEVSAADLANWNIVSAPSDPDDEGELPSLNW